MELHRVLALFLAVTSLNAPLEAQEVPQLNGLHLRITGLEENGFLDISYEPPSGETYQSFLNVKTGRRTYFSGYLVDMIDALSRENRANFTYTLLPPSGMGSLCVPQLESSREDQVYSPDYETQYNCGASDVNDAFLELQDDSGSYAPMDYRTDIYLGMYYVTPARTLINQFTIPFVPPFSGTLAMFGTATGLADFPALVKAQKDGTISPEVTCGPAGTALIESVIQAYPGLQIRGIFGNEQEIYEAFLDQSCRVYITDGPVAARFVFRRSLMRECTDSAGQPIGVIGDPMPFGLSHYAIGLRQDLDVRVEKALSYWINVLMMCNPLDPEGMCPDGNLDTFFKGRGGVGDECGYVLYPMVGVALTGMGISLLVVTCVVLVVALYTFWHRFRLERQRRSYNKKNEAALAQAKREREFNEYMSHEIRNPLASALAALSFVSSRASDPETIPSEEHRALISSDVSVIDSSLGFVDELLRNMLDLHRTQEKNNIKLNPVLTDIKQDIFEPVSTILFMRGASVDIQVVCPENLVVMGDRMRLKQICLNLASNSSKFVRRGYIRLRAEVISESLPATFSECVSEDGNEASDPEKANSQRCSKDNVVISVEDSGPGIPEQKRVQLFTRFQESLDVLNQGTGIGLSVCKNLSSLMGCNLGLDDHFDSGLPGCPGTRFVLELNTPPVAMEETHVTGSGRFKMQASAAKLSMRRFSLVDDLPDNVRVLFVDDDMVLRKMFSRVLQRSIPSWTITEAANGERALQLVEEAEFDLIIVDMYMASVEKQMLGTDTVRAMRAKGVKSLICGLSANDVEETFIKAGANFFMYKPFPCKGDALRKEMRRMLVTTDFSQELTVFS